LKGNCSCFGGWSIVSDGGGGIEVEEVEKEKEEKN